MKRPQFLYPYLTKVPLSTPIVPWVTIMFPHGLDGPAVIYPCGDTHEETEKVRELIENALNHGNTEGSGHASS